MKLDDKVNRLVESLVQSIELADGQGLEVSSTQKNFKPRWDHQTSASTTAELWDGKRWLSRPVGVTVDDHGLRRGVFSRGFIWPFLHGRSGNTVNWCDAEHRAVATRVWKIGRRRAAVPADVSNYLPGQRPKVESPWGYSIGDWSATIDENLIHDETLPIVTLTFTDPRYLGGQTVVYTIDRKRNVILEHKHTQDGKQISHSTYSDYIQVAGSWWPQTIKDFDDQNRVTREVSQTVKVLNQQAFTDRYNSLKPDEVVYQLIDFPLPTVAEARAKDAGATADFGDYLALILDACRIQDWTAAFEWFEKLKSIAPEKACVKAIQWELQIIARRNDEALKNCRAELERLAGNEQPNELFLVQYLLANVAFFTDNNERHELLNIAKPIFMRHQDQVSSMQYWQHKQVGRLRSLNRTKEANALLQQMVEAAPWNYDLHVSLAQNLANSGDHQAGVAWLEKQISLGDKWEDVELARFCSSVITMMESNHQLEELLERWMKNESTRKYAYADYLGVLVKLGRLADANETAKTWFKKSMRAEKLQPWELTRLEATINFVTGDPEWYEPLSEVAEYFLKHDHHYKIPKQILVNSRYRHTEQAKRGLRLAAEMLNKSIAEMKPARISSLVDLLSDFEDISKNDWLTIAGKLRQRWKKEPDDIDHMAIGNMLTDIYSRYASPEDLVAFLRARLKATVDHEIRLYEVQELNDRLFAALLRLTWNDQVEDAAFELLPQNSFPDDPAGILSTQITRLQRLSDATKNGVFAVADDQLCFHGHPEKLSRKELAQRRSKFKQQAIQHVADRLAAEHEKMRQLRVDERHPGLHEEFTKWVKLEQMHFTVLAANKTAGNLYDEDGDFGIVIKACREMLGQQPVATPDKEAHKDQDADKNDYLVKSQQRRQQRSIAILSNLAIRKSAPDALSEELLAYVQRGMQLPKSDANLWTNRYHMLLLALDRPEELEQSLRKLLRDSNDPVPLQLTLARLLAEQGKIEDAIGLAETAKSISTLSPSDLSTLAQWYLVADRRDDYQQARIDAFASMPEYQISNWLNQNPPPQQRNDESLPSELEEDTLFALQALFEKSQSPSGYSDLLRRHYTAYRDFRLLKMLPDAVVGRTPQQVYPFLNQLNSQVLHELRNEAALDKILQRITELRKTKTTSTDLRALDLLEAMVGRRGAEMLNQPGPHETAALAAMQRAFERDWASGEKLQMAKFLVGLKKVSNPKIAAEQLREIRDLYAQTTGGTDSHFRMSWYYAQVLLWNSQTDQAIGVMEVALRKYHEENKAGLPAGLNSTFNSYIDVLESKQRYAAAEKILLSEVDQVRNKVQEVWMKKRLNRCRYSAYSEGASISLGQGTELYRNLLDSFLKEAELLNEDYCYSVLEHIASMFKLKGRRDEQTLKADLQKYAFQQFPELIKRIGNNYSNAIDRLADIVHKEYGPKEGVRFLVERLENYPARRHGGWSLFNKVAKWRHEAQDLGPLQERVLKLALTNLRERLIVQKETHFGVLSKGSSYFWNEKEAEFVRVADEVATKYKDSAIVVVRVAMYLYHELHRYDQGIQMMQDAKERGLLSEQQEFLLAGIFHRRKQWKELVLFMEPWVAKRPENISYRCLLIKALSFNEQEAKRNKLLAETEAYLRENNLWNEFNVGMLASCVYNAKMYQVAVRLYDELIPMHQRARLNQLAQNGFPPRYFGFGGNNRSSSSPRGYFGGNNQSSSFPRGYFSHDSGNRLSRYYQNLAESHAQLGDTIAAVNAAAGGIVCRVGSQYERSTATSTLDSVILESKDRDGLIAHLDQQAEQTGQDSAIIRKALGIVLSNSDEPEKAITQLKLAIDLQPNDSETHRELIHALDEAEREAEATQQMIALLDFDRHNLDLYKRLANRLRDNDAMAERAATSLIEAAPLEADHHQALAELRQRQDRWDDAIDHWRHVAELRKLEPTGLLKLATAQVHEKKWDDAEATIKKLNQQKWPSQFHNLDHQIRKLQKQLPE